jgi:uncharacterized damage-inducible protein DinB
MTKGQIFLQEMQAETEATRKCIERVPESLYEYKPHEKSMAMGYMVLMLAEIPRWITHMIEQGDIDFGTFKHERPETTAGMVEMFDKNLEATKKALANVTDEALDKPFSLKMNGQALFTSPTGDNISSSLNHLVHHRGQLTVYMRLNDIAVPSLYGPTADEPGF